MHNFHSLLLLQSKLESHVEPEHGPIWRIKNHGKESSSNAGDAGSSPGLKKISNILVWRIPWTEEPGRLQSMGSQKNGHDLATTTTIMHASSHSQKKKIEISFVLQLKVSWFLLYIFLIQLFSFFPSYPHSLCLHQTLFECFLNISLWTFMLTEFRETATPQQAKTMSFTINLSFFLVSFQK